MFIGILCVLLISLSITAGIILCIHYWSIPYLKKNVLTRLDELFVQNYIFFVIAQCCICLFSLLDENRNKYIYLFFYFILYTSLCIGFGVAIGLSCCRVLIITEVSSRKHLKDYIYIGKKSTLYMTASHAYSPLDVLVGWSFCRSSNFFK